MHGRNTTKEEEVDIGRRHEAQHLYGNNSWIIKGYFYKHFIHFYGIIVLYSPKPFVAMLMPSPRLAHASAFLKRLIASPLLLSTPHP
jgi:hypothetical protein